MTFIQNQLLTIEILLFDTCTLSYRTENADFIGIQRILNLLHQIYRRWSKSMKYLNILRDVGLCYSRVHSGPNVNASYYSIICAPVFEQVVFWFKLRTIQFSCCNFLDLFLVGRGSCPWTSLIVNHNVNNLLSSLAIEFVLTWKGFQLKMS